jgi:hypothetical protein
LFFRDISRAWAAGRGLPTPSTPGSVDWSGVVTAIVAASPANASFSSIQVVGSTTNVKTSGTETIDVSGKLSGATSFAPVAGWVSSLKAVGFGVSVTSITTPTSGTDVAVEIKLTGSTVSMQLIARKAGGAK